MSPLHPQASPSQLALLYYPAQTKKMLVETIIERLIATRGFLISSSLLRGRAAPKTMVSLLYLCARNGRIVILEF